MQCHINNNEAQFLLTYIHIEDNKMSISTMMLAILERLAEMFPRDGYQSRLERYLNTKSITDAATLDNYIKEFEYQSHKDL